MRVIFERDAIIYTVVGVAALVTVTILGQAGVFA